MNDIASPTSEQLPPVSTFSLWKTLIYSLLPVVVLLGSMEGCARIIEIWWPPLTLDYGWGFNADSHIFAPAGIMRNRMVTRPEKMVSFPMQSFVMPKPEDTYRIIVLRGSNVHYMLFTLLGMAKRLADTPGETRQFEVINLGGLAYGSYRLRIMIPEALSYTPDIVLIYAGHNEFEEIKHQALVATEKIPVQKVAYSFAMLRLLRDMVASADLVRRFTLSIRTERPPEVDHIAASMYEYTESEIDERMMLYRGNLESIVKACCDKGVPIVMSTVASNLWNPGLHERFATEKQQIVAHYAAGQYTEGMRLARDILSRSSRHQASDVENNIIREVAAAYGLPLIEGERIIMEAEPHGVPGETLLSDVCHITAKGRQLVISAFETEIRRLAHVGG